MIDENFIVDMEHHFIPSRALKLVGKTREHDFGVGLRRFREAYEIMGNINVHLEFMDASGIDMSILSTGAFSPNGYDFCKACNDGYSEAVKEYPNSLKGMIQVYPHDEDKNRDEIKRGVEELGLWGIALVSSYGETTIDSTLMNPLYEIALKYDMPVFIHPTVRTNLWGGERYDLYTTVSREYDIAKSLVEIIYGVLPRFPELKVIMAHLGGGLPTLKGRLLAHHKAEGFCIAEEDRGQGMSVDEAKEMGLFGHFEFQLRNMLFNSAGYGGWLPVIKSAFESLGADRICFGTDYPYQISKPKYVRKIITDVNQLNIANHDKKQFLSENLRRLFCKESYGKPCHDESAKI